MAVLLAAGGILASIFGSKAGWWAPLLTRIHKTLRATPAMAANVTKRLWEIGDVVDVLEAWEKSCGEASARQWCGSKGAYNRPSYPCHYCTYRGGLLRQGAVDKAKADDQRHAGERQHHHLQVRKAVGGKQQIVHDTPPKDVPVISRSEPAESSAVGTQWHVNFTFAAW